jgi:hypothetical protein
MPVNFSNAVGQKVVERTNTLIKIPNNYGIYNRLNLFTDRYASQKTIEIVRNKYGEAVLGDRNWDERNQTITGRQRDYVTAKIPHFPLDDAITANDLDGLAQFIETDSKDLVLETIASVRMEKMEVIRGAHAKTLDVARAQLILDGTVYAPNGTVVTNWYTAWGFSAPTPTDTPLLGAVDPRAKFQRLKNSIQDSLLNGQTARGFICFCSPEYYEALVTNPFVAEAVKYTQSNLNSSILVGTTDEMGLGMLGQSVSLWGITFIEVRESYKNLAGATVKYITAGEARMMPVGLSGFLETFYAPANRLSTVNKKSQGSYWFEHVSTKDDIIEIMTEQNFMNVCHQPQAIVQIQIPDAELAEITA